LLILIYTRSYQTRSGYSKETK